MKLDDKYSLPSYIKQLYLGRNLSETMPLLGEYLENVTIGPKVTSIKTSQFKGCSSLPSITIPNTVANIGDKAFDGCSSLKTMIIEDGDTELSIGENSSLPGVLEKLYLGRYLSVAKPNFGSYLKEVTIGPKVTSINEEYFKNYRSLTSVSIPNTMICIGKDAFYGCSSLATFVIPNSVDSIAPYAFHDCTNLKELTVQDGDTKLTLGGYESLPSSIVKLYFGRNIVGTTPQFGKYLAEATIGTKVTSVIASLFYECSSLSSVIIPNSIISIEKNAFYGCSSLSSILIPNSVTSIGESAFSECSSLSSAIISNSVTSIGASAFSFCSSLTSINIPNAVTSINSHTFFGCSKLSTITIPNSVTSIGERVFSGCSNLSSITIPNSINNIGLFAFEKCETLKSVKIEECDSALVFTCSGFEDSLLDSAYIGRNLSGTPFKKNESLKVVELSDKVTRIADYEFDGCSNLQKVSIPNSVTSIGEYAFRKCASIQSIKFPDALTTIMNSAFAGCRNLKTITIPTTVKNIGSYAFGDCDIVKAFWLSNTPPEGAKYNLPAKVNYVSNDNYTFDSYYNPRVVKYPYLSSMFEVDGVRYIPVSPSERTCDAVDCTYDSTNVNVVINKTVNYKGVELAVNNVNPYCFYGNEHIKTAKLTSVLGIDDHAFYGCMNLQGFDIPNTTTTIGSYAFYGCSNLAEATIGRGIKKINDYTFSCCSSLADITIPQNVDSIGNYVFGGCTALEKFTIADRNTELSMGYNGNNEPMFKDCPLKSVYIGGNITYPTSQEEGYSPFYRNTSLETVEITDKETEISDNEFYGCTGLKDVTIGDGIEKIGNYAFSGCSSLEIFSFGTSLKTIGEEAFSDCTAMTKLVAKTHEPPVCGSQALDDINKWECKLYVPIGREEAYKIADQWKQFFFIDGSIETSIGNVEMEDNLKDAQYYGLDGIRKVHIQKGVNIVRMSDGTTRKVLKK